MKLLYVAPSAYLLGGVQDWLADLVAGQRRLGVEVTVAVPNDVIHLLEPYAARYPDLNAIPFTNPSGSELGRIHALCALLRRHRDHLVVGVNIAALYPAVRRLRRQGTFRGRVVMTLHAIEPEYFEDLRAQRDLLDAVVVTNRLSGALARQLGGMEEARILYAPYGVALEASPLGIAAPDQLAGSGPRALGVPKGSATPPQQLAQVPGLNLVWVGRLESPQKRVQDLGLILAALDAAGQPFNLTIAGDGPERTSLESGLTPWIQWGQVRLTGPISRQRLHAEIYGRGRVLLITSSWETGPIVAWEAMAAGMAVVSSRYVGSGLENALVEGHTALLYPVGDAAAAARQLIRLSTGPLLTELVAGGLDLVRSRYSREASLAAWMAAFTAVQALPALPSPAPGPAPLAAGGLDRLLGPGPAQTMRLLLHRGFRHGGAGSEWPHSGHAAAGPQALLEWAARLDHHG